MTISGKNTQKRASRAKRNINIKQHSNKIPSQENTSLEKYQPKKVQP